MSLIKKIEITNFRSLTSVVLNDVADMNVVFGENDVGKSNVLRALNLFFNDETAPDTPYRFEVDYPNGGAGDRKFTWVAITFNVPSNYHRSLGKTLRVKRQWSGGRATAHESLGVQGAGATFKRNASRFLGTIRYHHVPAIKSRKLFEQLLGEIYAILLEDSGFQQVLNQFAEDVQSRTRELSRGLQVRREVVSKIAPPTDLRQLFRTLDFRTGDEGKLSLLEQRGDGVKAGHIPELLEYICDKGPHKLHIWGFEEPENSLSYASASREAKFLHDVAGWKERQVFVTSHSPVFYNLVGDNVARWYVCKPDEDGSSVRLLSEERGEELMDDEPYLVLMARQLKAVQAEMKKKEDTNRALRERVAKLTGALPLLVVEGPTDKMHLEAAWAALRPGTPLPVQISEWGGVLQMKAIGKLHDRAFSKLFGARRVLVLVDDDPDGRDASHNWFAKGSKPVGGLFRRCSPKNKNANASNWARLPCTAAYKAWATSLKLQPGQHRFVIEHLFDDDVHEEAIRTGVLSFHDNPSEDTIQAVTKRGKKLSLYLSEVDADPMLTRFVYPLSKNESLKVEFAEWTSNRARKQPQTYAHFESIVAGIEAAVAS